MTAAGIPAGRRASRTAAAGRDETRIFDAVAYWAASASLYLTGLGLWWYSFKEKILDGGGTPPPIVKQFSGSFVDSTIGIDAAWTMLGIVEGVVFLLFVVSLVRGEFLPARRKPILLGALAAS